jgi:hypothetical protein
MHMRRTVMATPTHTLTHQTKIRAAIDVRLGRLIRGLPDQPAAVQRENQPPATKQRYDRCVMVRYFPSVLLGSPRLRAIGLSSSCACAR